MKPKTCVCDVAKDDHEITNNKCDICELPINMDFSLYGPTPELRFLQKITERINHSDLRLSNVLQQKWEDNQGNFKWVDVPTVKEQ